MTGQRGITDTALIRLADIRGTIEVNCPGSDRCVSGSDKSQISVSNSPSFRLLCTSGMACRNMRVDIDDGSHAEIVCRRCEEVDVAVRGQSSLNITCTGQSGCLNGGFNVSAATWVQIHCFEFKSCDRGIPEAEWQFRNIAEHFVLSCLGGLFYCLVL